MKLEFTGHIKHLDRLQTKFNEADEPRGRLVYAMAMEVSLRLMLRDLETRVIPPYQGAAVESVYEELAGKQ